MIAVIDYGVGNLHSLTSALDFIGATWKVTNQKEDLKVSDRIILPGVGAFAPAIDKLNATGLVSTLLEEVEKGKPLFGICLGMQLLYERSFEYGEHRGLGLVPGDIIFMKELIKAKVPHMGWNKLDFHKDSPILKYIKDGDYVYYVHSYFAHLNESTVASSLYDSINITGITQYKNVYGTQFHPEKSGDTGLNILKAFLEL